MPDSEERDSCRVMREERRVLESEECPWPSDFTCTPPWQAPFAPLSRRRLCRAVVAKALDRAPFAPP